MEQFLKSGEYCHCTAISCIGSPCFVVHVYMHLVEKWALTFITFKILAFIIALHCDFFMLWMHYNCIQIHLECIYTLH